MENPTRPTRARFVVVAFLSTLVFVLYVDRICIGKARGAIERDLGLSHTQMGLVFGAFTLAYGLFEVPTGRWGDRFGSRGVLTRIVLWWSVFTALTGCVWKFSFDSGITYHLAFRSWQQDVPLVFNSFVLLLLIRFLFGAGEAGALPNTARVVARWIPVHERGMAQGIILTCMQLGGAVSPIVATYLIKAVGWRLSFVILGSLGVVWGSLFYWWFRDDPASHPAVNDAEKALCNASAEPGTTEHPAIPWRLVLSSANVWLMGLIMTASAFASYMYMFWLPTYLEEARGVSESKSGWLSGSVLAGAAIGSFCGGPLSTSVVQWTGETRWTRRLLGFSLVAAAGLFLGGSIYCDSPTAACLCIAMAGVCGQAQVSNWWAVTMDISGKHLGAMFGLLNSLGVPGAIASPIFLGSFADYRKSLGFTGRAQWDPAFAVYSAILLAGATCWLLVDSTKSAVEVPDESRAPHS
ncbi:MAG TPA: MFS transporter [Planctomycetaceae bacterium]|nr:MFS transporter [Planctomycetaceae bacterium]